jgi:hypothetical protein
MRSWLTLRDPLRDSWKMVNRIASPALAVTAARGPPRQGVGTCRVAVPASARRASRVSHPARVTRALMR